MVKRRKKNTKKKLNGKGFKENGVAYNACSRLLTACAALRLPAAPDAWHWKYHIRLDSAESR